MSITRIALFSVAISLACAVSVAEARQAKPDPKPEPKTEAPAALTGKWNVTVESPNGASEASLDLKVDGKKVAGTIASQIGEAKLEGELVDARLTFWFTLDANGQQINVTFKGTQQKDGTLAGTLDYGQGDVPWKATRAK